MRSRGEYLGRYTHKIARQNHGRNAQIGRLAIRHMAVIFLLICVPVCPCH